MKEKDSHLAFIGYRAELMAELFLQELAPTSLLRPPSTDIGFDFLVTFRTRHGRQNTFAVEVKATERDLDSMFVVNARALHRLVSSNIPGFFLIANVKNNSMFYSWPDPDDAELKPKTGQVRIAITRLDESNKRALLKRLLSADPTRSDAGA